MKDIYINRTNELCSFIAKSPTAYQAVDQISEILSTHESERYTAGTKLKKGGSYHFIRNGSSVIAVKLPKNMPISAMIIASHTDSPTFKLKPNFEKEVFGKYIVCDTEKYGGMIISSWLDRPLSVAGRIAVRDGNGIKFINVSADRDLMVIPNLCIHFNRSINDGYKYDPRNDCLPLYSEKGNKELLEIIAETAGVKCEDILSHDLYLYNRTPASIWGPDLEFFSAPRIDNLECAYTTLQGFINAENDDALLIYASFDNEEVGSATKQGAASGFLSDVIETVLSVYGNADMNSLLASSLMLSADNAHAVHPTHPEYYDMLNAPHMNKGVVIKTNANQRYTTDAVSSALFEFMCKDAGVPVQNFANRSDIAGGSTLGSISNTRVSLNTVDIGIAQLAMHSSWESAGTKDAEYMVQAAKRFYSSVVKFDGTDRYEIIN